MAVITILYPNGPGARFDHDYYVRTHMPLSVRLLGAHDGYRGVTVERGVAGSEPDSPPAFLALCRFDFTSVEAFVEASAPHAAVLQGDIVNYTNVAPVIQVNEVLLQDPERTAPDATPTRRA